ncbi:unnamed protein product [Enterobius vermicularis]|uniref:Fucosyltransferase n=1 Tax=Enterobius vermicularis TaxID=51028 RepID=A0A0N4UVN0_ENTVE|nr:unnamed protein product [Enterobius vermicularis]
MHLMVIFNAESWAYLRIDRFSVRDIPPIRNDDQLYVFRAVESPYHTLPQLSLVPPNFFNITMTYRYVTKALSRKTESVLEISDICETVTGSETYKYVLKNYINVTEMGNCFGYKCNSSCEEDYYASHHFLLAFEKEICKDYVTKKFFKIKQHFIVPIVLKDSIYRNIAPPYSYIAADNFASPKQLADYLKYLERNHEEYKKYFEWRRSFRKERVEPNFCELCKMLHDVQRPRKVISDIHSWWNTYSKCQEDYGRTIAISNRIFRFYKKFVVREPTEILNFIIRNYI